MATLQKLIGKILSRKADNNIEFNHLVLVLKSLNFKHRQNGSHNIFTKPNIAERLNLQSDESKAKCYQVKQIRNILIKYNLV